jgi:HAD superfamily hydrolase (TIGR01490 family)
MTPVRAAFFDLDRTVVSGASAYWFAKAALRWGMYSRREMTRDAWRMFWFKRRGDTGELTETVRDQALAMIAGHSRTQLDVLLPDVLAPVLSNLYPEMYQRILEHEGDGVRTYLCSASPVEIVGLVAKVLNMSGGALATVAETDTDGRYTGALDGPFCYGEGKVVAIAQEAAAVGIDLAASYAYSDSVTDLPMLECVGIPVAVNPDAQLAAIARDREWEVLRFEPRLGVRTAVGAGVVTGVTAAAVGSVMWATRRPRA